MLMKRCAGHAIGIPRKADGCKDSSADLYTVGSLPMKKCAGHAIVIPREMGVRIQDRASSIVEP